MTNSTILRQVVACAGDSVLAFTVVLGVFTEQYLLNDFE